MKFNIEFDVSNDSISRGLAVLRRRRVRYGIALALLAVPAVAIAAPVAIPNDFVAGEVISASEMNANFSAVKASVDDNDARLTSLEGGLNVGACTWRVNLDSTSEVIADCGPNLSVVSGSCSSSDLNNRLQSHSARPTANSNLDDNDPGGAAQVYMCRFASAAAGNTQHAARALCCPN